MILSQEGITQGNPLAMFMYAVGILRSIQKLKNQIWNQNCYADDSACFGRFYHIQEWFIKLQIEGLKWDICQNPERAF